MVKFQGDRSRELGEREAKQKKHLGQNISPSGTVVPGGLINAFNIYGRPNDQQRLFCCLLSAGAYSQEFVSEGDKPGVWGTEVP